MKVKTILSVAMIAYGFLVAPLAAQDSKPAPDPAKRQVFFGEQHLHTSASPDAFVIGVRGTWEDAYNWAMGNEITLSTTLFRCLAGMEPRNLDHAPVFGIRFRTTFKIR